LHPPELTVIGPSSFGSAVMRVGVSVILPEVAIAVVNRGEPEGIGGQVSDGELIFADW